MSKSLDRAQTRYDFLDEEDIYGNTTEEIDTYNEVQEYRNEARAERKTWPSDEEDE